MRPPDLDLAAFPELPFPVATTRELARAGMLPVEAMGRRLVAVWNGGTPRVFEDACPHLGFPLTRGRLVGDDRLRCVYHGWEFSLADGQVLSQPTLKRERRCSLVRFGALVAGDLVFAWLGDPAREQQVRARLPEHVPTGISLHRVEFACPFYLALFNSVDYAHFPRHAYYQTFYALYRRLRGNAHVPGRPFSSRVVDEDERMVRIRIDEAGRDIRMYMSASEFVDDGGVNHFQTFVTPIGPTRTLYWECFRPRGGNPLLTWLARLMFHTVIVRLLDGEDREWTAESTPAFLRGTNTNLCENDLPLAAHLKKFVNPALERWRAAGTVQG